MYRPTAHRWMMIPILWLTFALCIPALNGPRFHPDEALFASFARSIAVWRDPLLAAAPVDKPPLLFYLQALCYPFLGPQEMAARLPNLFASLLTVALTGTLTHHASRITPPISPLAAALLVALSPLAIAFGSTAFTDPLMVMWGMAALLAAIRERPAWAGFLLGLGLITKYQAIFFLPLVVGFLWLQPGRRRWQGWAQLALGTMLPLAAGLAWELARTGRGSLLAQQLTSYGELRPIYAGELWPRLLDWAQLAHYITGSPALNTLLLAAIVALPFWLLIRRPSPVAVGLLLSGWLLHYFLLHWLLNIQTWDRYLLPAVPIAAAFAGWSLSHITPRVQGGAGVADPFRAKKLGWGVLGLIHTEVAEGHPSLPPRVRGGCPEGAGGASLSLIRMGESKASPPPAAGGIEGGPGPGPFSSLITNAIRNNYPLLIIIALLLLPNARQAAAGALPLGGDHGTYQGVEQVAEFFADHPYGTVLYDHWLSWHWRYYLFDSRVYVSWFPDPAALVADLQVFSANPPRYLVIPAWESPLPIVQTLQAAGFHARVAFQAHRPDGTLSMSVWEIRALTNSTRSTSASPGQPGGRHTRLIPNRTRRIPGRTRRILSRTHRIPSCTRLIPGRTRPIPNCTHCIPGCTHLIQDYTSPIPDYTHCIPDRTRLIPNRTGLIRDRTHPIPAPNKGHPKIAAPSPKQRRAQPPLTIRPLWPSAIPPHTGGLRGGP